MQAITYQFCTLSEINPQRLLRAQRSLQERRIEIGNIHKVDFRLRKGDLEGNRFEIIVRNVRRVRVRNESGVLQEELVPCDAAHLQRMVQRIRNEGFVNFHGEQRVGVAGSESVVGVRGFDIGRAMLRQDFSLAVDLLLAGRLICRGSDAESDEIQAVRRVWKETGGDPFETWKHLPRGAVLPRERLVLKGLKRYGKGDPLSSFRCLHYNERMFMISAYQSFVWNAMATKRIELHGTDVVPGDLILRRDEEIEVVAEGACDHFKPEDVVLPLPGYNIKYPDNDIGALYEDMMKKDGVSFQKDAPLESTAKGSYRRLFVKARNMSFHALESEKGTHLKIKFDLPRGSYATMFLRELMLTTVVRE